jgi:hypothetical protein
MSKTNCGLPELYCMWAGLMPAISLLRNSPKNPTWRIIASLIAKNPFCDAVHVYYDATDWKRVVNSLIMDSGMVIFAFASGSRNDDTCDQAVAIAALAINDAPLRATIKLSHAVR